MDYGGVFRHETDASLRRADYPAAGALEPLSSVIPTPEFRPQAIRLVFVRHVQIPPALHSRDTYSPDTCSRVISATTFLGDSSATSGVTRANKSRLRAMRPVQPVW